MLLIITKLLIQGSGEDGDGEGGPAQDHLQRNGQGVHGLRAGTVRVSCSRPFSLSLSRYLLSKLSLDSQINPDYGLQYESLNICSVSESYEDNAALE